MTTTTHFQKTPEYYKTIEECNIAKRKKNIQTNPRYKNFKQTHFTAGDEDQFEEFRDMSNGQVCIPNIILDKVNRFYLKDNFSMWIKYQNLNAIAVSNTFNYLFHKFKKGTFVKIQNNKLKVFLPFSKKNFVNEWGDQIKVDPKYGNMYDFAQYINKLNGKHYKVNVNSFTNNWYANNCLVRYEYPINEGDSNVTNISDMLNTLCETRKIPDIEFFMNRRDFPQLKKDGTEAYEHLFGDNKPLLSHNYDQYSPLLSMVTTKNHADIPIPTGEDWARISSQEGKFFSDCKDYPKPDNFLIKWSDRKPTAVFRGASTGCGVTIDTNMRLKIAYISVMENLTGDKNPLLDAGISKWQLRPRKLNKEKYLQTIDVPALNKLGINIASFLTPTQQAGYKYLVNVDGHVSAFRLSLEMCMGCCILLVDSKYKLWFRDMLKPMVHYVPIKSDLSDLMEQIKWCRENDKICEKIASNAKKFYLKYLQKEGILDYMQKLLIDLKNTTGLYLYNTETPLQVQISKEKEKIASVIYPTTDKQISDIGKIPKQSRSFGILKGVEWIVNMVNDKSSFTEVAEKSEQIFSNSAKTIFVDKYKLAGYVFAVKSTENNIKMIENIHETFIGIKVINEVVKYIPNFVYIFGSKGNNGNNVITEYINGKTMGQWINSDSFNMKDFIFILIQLALALEVAQRQCGFVHYDLTPWNIIIQELPNVVKFDYMLDQNNIYTVNTKVIPVIIDYGKSHVIYQNKHYGFINMFKMSTIQDIISIIITSLNDIIELSHISKNDLSDIIKLANFLSGTGYKKQTFKQTGPKGVSDIKFFVTGAKKYAEMISSNKYELEEKTPLDFIQYIIKNFEYKLPFEKIKQPIFRINRGNPRQVFEYILSSTVNEKVKSFVNVFDRILECNFYNTEDLILSYYVAQILENYVTSVWTIMVSFLNVEKIDSKQYEKKYKKVISKIENSIKEFTTPTDNFSDNDIYNNKVEITPYTQDSFLSPNIIIKLLENYKNKVFYDLSEYKNIIDSVLLNQGIFKMSDEMKIYYKNKFLFLLETKNVNMKVNVANFITLLNTAKIVYTKDKKFLIDQNCTEIKKYLSSYKKILNTITNIET